MNDIHETVARQRAFFETGKTLPVAYRKEALARLRREILALPPKYREVILLRYYEGFAVGEIAHMLNAPQPTESIRIRRACKLLEKRLEGVPREDM